MKLASSLALLTCTTLAHAQDIRITATGTVSEIIDGGVAAAPFANVAIGEPATIVFDVEPGNQVPFGIDMGLLNWPTSTVTIGNATAGMVLESQQQLLLQNDTASLGDSVSVNSLLDTAPSTEVLFVLFDPTTQLWATNQWTELIGLQLDPTNHHSAFWVRNRSGEIRIDVETFRGELGPGGPLGTSYCNVTPNSTGLTGELRAYGLATPSDNDMTLVAHQLPTQSMGYFVVSAMQGFVANPGGSDGNLCMSGSIGRFARPGEVKGTDFGGEYALAVDLTDLPTPVGAVAVQAGQTWNFQLWHRDDGASGPSSNFTRALAVTFQ